MPSVDYYKVLMKINLTFCGRQTIRHIKKNNIYNKSALPSLIILQIHRGVVHCASRI